MRPLRPLLPDVEGSRRQQSSLEPSSKRRKVTLACDACRQRKTKCNGVRPSCETCIKFSTTCTYSRVRPGEIRQRFDEVQQREVTYEALVDLLRNASEQEFIAIVHRLRAGTSAASIVSQVRDGNLLLQLSLVPETRRLYEFPYRLEMPSYVFTSDNVYLNSTLYEALSSCWGLRSSAPNEDKIDQHLNADGKVPSHQRDSPNGKQRAARSTKYRSAHVIPYHAAHAAEPQVEKITLTPWTRVISDDKLLRRLIRAYFYYPHPLGPFVHKDLFLDDMAAGRSTFCSPLLVNAMLAIGVVGQSCHDIANRSKLWLPDSLTYKFVAEARRLWDLEPPGTSRISTIQAALVLSYAMTNNSLDALGTMFLEQAIRMSKALGLFGPETGNKDTPMSKARTFTAWAVFSWQAGFDYYFFRPPHLAQPPEAALPDPRLHPNWYGENWVQYPSSITLDPLHNGFLLHSQSTLFAIVNEMGLLLFGRTSSASLSIDEIASFKHKLDSWWASLPEALQPQHIIYPQHLTLHIQYHQIVLTLAKLLPQTTPSAICSGKTPASLLTASSTMLETLIRIYYARHSFAAYDPWVTFALVITGNLAAATLSSAAPDTPAAVLDDHRSTLILSAQGLETQAAHYHLGTLSFIQLLAATDPETLQLVRTYVGAPRAEGQDKLRVEHSFSTWPIPIIGVNEDPERVRLKNLLREFEVGMNEGKEADGVEHGQVDGAKETAGNKDG